VSLRKE